MAKAKTAFVCNDCGADFPKWQGQCGECHAWNTLSEIRLSAPAGKSSGMRAAGRTGFAGSVATVKRLEEVAVVDLPRLSSGFEEFDRVLGGGLIPGSSILIGGHPGAGKSTLLLQTLCYLASEHSALYVTGEESPEQIAMRANRLSLPTDQLQLMAETDVDTILSSAESLKPKILVVDSIQV
ncbi:MAG: DNA repair protein RadA, partial [Gammaproteobacteria bacterium]|nr:DNA repair protein RadA [Gammaproteobacteria bacterium]